MEIIFTWIGGATWVLEVQGVRIGCDPVLCPAGTVQNYGFFRSKRLNDPVFKEGTLQQVDLWLITHGHADHLDSEGFAYISREARLITHANAARTLQNAGLRNLDVLRWGEKRSFTIQDIQIEIEAIPAVHGANPLSAFFAGGVNGYWLKLQHNEKIRSIYVTSDTVLHSKVRQALQGRQTDLLIPNMGAVKADSWMGPLTLSANMLKELIAIVNPVLCIPVHFGTFEHYVEPISAVKQLGNEGIVILKPGQMHTITG